MPELERPGGITIHCDEQGEGPLVLLLHHWFSYPDVYRGLIDEIAQWQSEWSRLRIADRVRELLPEAQMHVVGEGPISRPELTADVVRQAVRSGTPTRS
jgi:hypothetical protein